MRNIKQSKTDRHTTVKKTATPPDSPPFISCGKHDKKILQFLILKNIKRYSHRSTYLNLGISKSSYADSLNRMNKNKLIVLRENAQKPIVTELGRGVAELENHVPWGVAEGLSTHKLEYKLKITSIQESFLTKINQLDTIKPPHIYYLRGNNRVINIYYQHETIVIYPKCILIKVHELLGDTDKTHTEGFKIALKRLGQLQGLGLETDNRIELQDGHYEIIKNAFTNVLNQIGHNFYMVLNNGTKLWIDHSKKTKSDEGSQGLESNSPEVRDSAYNLFNDAIEGYRLKDIGEIKDDLEHIKEALKLTVENFSTILQIEKEKNKALTENNKNINTRPDYIY